MKLLINFLRLTRPLSNIKNLALVLATFYISGGEFDFLRITVGIISLSLICSANYAYNNLYDYEADKINKNKKHHSKSIEYFGEKNSRIVVFLLTLSGYITGFLINIYFLVSLIFLSLTGFLYSSEKIRFKKRIVLDILFGATLTFFFRFIASWFIFSISIPPLLVVMALVSAKSAGYMLYKEIDRTSLLALKIRNSITVVSKKTIIVISALLWLVSFSSFIFLCLNSKYFQIRYLGNLPIKFLFLILFAVPPLIVIYLSILNKIKTEIRYLRVIGFFYWILVMIIIWRLFS